MPEPKSTSLRARVLRGGGWTVAGLALGQGLRLCSSLIMTRLLVPEMFGIMAIATTLGMVLNMLSDVGLRQNIVQSKRGDDPLFLDTAWIIQITRGLILWFIAMALAFALHLANLGELVPANSVYASPVLPLVIAINSFSAVIVGLQSTRLATAHRHLNQKRMIQIELLGQLAGLAIMVVAGFATRSIWSMVGGGLAASLTITILSHAWMDGQPNRFRRDGEALRELVAFGRWVFISSTFSVLAAYGDRLLLGLFVDSHTLGIYAIAMLIISAIESALRKLYVMISLPALSEIRRTDPSRLREAYYKFRMPSDLLLLFIVGMLFAAGQIIIDVLYDPRYSQAGEILRILALSLFWVRYGVAHQIYLAVGMPRYLTIVHIVRFLSFYTLVPGLYYLYGVEGAIWGVALHTLPVIPFIYRFNARLNINDFRRELLVLVALPTGYLIGIDLTLLRQ